MMRSIATPQTPWRYLSLLGLFALFGLPTYGATFHVDISAGADTAGCGTIASPCASIQQAVNLATDGDLILVAQGTYTYQAALDPCGADIAAVCVVEKQLTIRAGFSPPDWSNADPQTNVTIIDGENAFRGLLVKKTFPGSASDAALTLEGFTIERGRVEGTSGDPDALGGGISALLVKSLTLRNLIVQNNVAIGADVSSGPGGIAAGGGIYISTSIPSLPLVQVTLENVELLNNQVQGGATLSNDRGGFGEGAGLFINRSVLHATDLIVTGNIAAAGNSTGSGTTGNVRSEALGGGIAILRDTTVTIERLVSSDNSATGGSASNSTGIGGTGAGGGLYVEGSSLILRDSDFRRNQTRGGGADTGGLGTGGGITSFDADVELDRVVLIDNQAAGGDGVSKKGSVGGGGAYLERALDPNVTATITNTLFADNRVDLGAGGGTVGGGGGGLFVLGNMVQITHATFAQNQLGGSPLVGHAITVSPRLGSASEATITDSIIADHTSLPNVAAVQAQSADSTVTFVNGLFSGNTRDTNSGLANSGTITGLGTMQSSASAGFNSPGNPNFDYHLTGASAAIDQTTTLSVQRDFDRTFRSAPFDWGADEYCSAAEDTLLLQGQTVTSFVLEEACEAITAGSSYEVTNSGEVIFRAGARVILTNGFSVDAGGQLIIDVRIP